MSQTVQALSIGHALDVESANAGAVHSVFRRAVNFTMRGDMWTLLTDDRADLPFGIRVPLASFETLRLRRGDHVHVRAGFVGLGQRLVADCRAAPRWVPVTEPSVKPGLDGRLAVVARAAQDRSWHKSAQMARALRCAVEDTSALSGVLAQVVGRGPGATPSGDDVLVGVLAVLKSPHSCAAGARAAESLGRSIFPLLSTTTDVSGSLLRQAVDGLFGRDVHELVSALIGGPPAQELIEKVRRVIETGATSGADTCEGLLAFASSFLPTSSEEALV